MNDLQDRHTRYNKRKRIVASATAALCAVALLIAAFALPFMQPASTVAPSVALQEGVAFIPEGLEGGNSQDVVSEPKQDDTAENAATTSDAAAKGYEPGVVLVQLAEGASAADLNAALADVACVQSVSVSDSDIALGYVELPLAQNVEVRQAASQLNKLAVVQDSQPNYLYRQLDDASHVAEGLTAGSVPNLSALATQASVSLNDPRANEQWALESIHAYEAWGTVKSNGRVSVAVLDNGCFTGHEDLKNNIVCSYDATGYMTIKPRDDHGTHVAGIIAAEANNGKGVAGVSYNASIIPVQVFTAKSGRNAASTATLVRAYEWLIENKDYYNIRVANMSLGIDAEDKADMESIDKDKLLYAAVKRARTAGILTVCSAGNNAENGPYLNYPSDYLADCAINVMALQQGKNGKPPTRVDYSNYNSPGQKTKEISAPGLDILSTGASGSYVDSSGTSMAAPCVSGVAALLFAANPNLTPDRVENILLNTASDLGASGWDVMYGAGEVNAQAAVENMGDYLDGVSSVLKGGSTTLTPSRSGSWTWSSSDTGVATVNSAGVVTGKKGGAAVITAQQGTKQVSRTVTVYDVSFSGAKTVEAGDTINLVFNEHPNTGMWLIESSDESIATVDEVTNDYTKVTGVKEGSTTVRAKLASNKSLVVEYPVQVKKARGDFSKASISLAGWTYDGTAHTPNVTVRINGVTVPSSAYTVSYSNNKNAGICTATVRPTNTALYKNTGKGTCTVARRPVTLTSASASKTYDGKALSASGVTITGSGFVAGEVSRVWATGSITNAGQTANTISYSTGPGFSATNYNITKNAGKLTVVPASISGASVASIGDHSYTGYAIQPQPTVKLNGKTLVRNTDYTLSYKNNVNGPTATVIITGKGNYAGSINRTFAITQTDAQKAHGVQYQTHVQNVGWQNWMSSSQTAGTSGRSLRLEGIRIKLADMPYTGSIQYRTHIQNIGWQGWKSNGDMSGTSGRALRLEAIQIRLTGEMAKHYDVYYRVHAQNFGWMGWARNGAEAGTSGYAYRLEAIQIMLIPKTGFAPGSTSNAYQSKSGGSFDGAPDMPYLVHYRTHVQNVGWQNYVRDGAMSGTSGRSLRLEGINISLGSGVSGSIRYRTHVQNIGWQDWRWNGAMSGTSGRALRLEGIQIELSGQAAQNYDVWYRVHAQNFGWMGWTKNGGQAGTAGYAYRLEGIQVKLLPKGSSAPGSTSNAFRKR